MELNPLPTSDPTATAQVLYSGVHSDIFLLSQVRTETFPDDQLFSFRLATQQQVGRRYQQRPLPLLLPAPLQSPQVDHFVVCKRQDP